MGSLAAKIIKVVSKLLSVSRIKAGIAAAKRGFDAFKRWYDDLPWIIRIGLDGFGIYDIYTTFKDNL